VTLRRTLAVAGVAGLALVPAAAARSPQIALVSAFTSARESPPLRTPASAVETRFFGPLRSSQTVTVTIDSTGRISRVVDVDRIVVPRKGDYSFAVNAPVEDVRGAQGTESEPGLRTGAVVWQGFAPTPRLLAAAITVRSARAVEALPLRIELDGRTLELVNTTTAAIKANEAPAAALQIARALDASYRAVAADTPVAAPVISALGPPRDVLIRGVVPVRVRGTVATAQGSKKVDALVGRTPVRIELGGPPRKLALTVSTPNPEAVLRPPGRRRWVDLARSGRLGNGGAATRAANERLLAAALARQFRQFLPNPDVRGSTRTSYRYVLGAVPATPSGIEHAGGGFPWAAVSLAVAAALAVLGGVVFWAHS